jgi:hypothetical protein
MALTDVALCNLALDQAHTRSSISRIGENSAQGQACARWYDTSRRAVLRSCHWNFARRQQTLALLQDSTATPPGTVPQPWVYEYAYPQDCILARQVLPTLGNPQVVIPSGWSSVQTHSPPARFIVGNDVDVTGNDIRVILTNQPQAQLVYTRDVTATALFDDEFVQAFTAYLACKLAQTLGGDKGVISQNFQLADQISRAARSRNGNEGGPTVIDIIPDWIRARGFLSDWAYPPGALWLYDPVDLTLVA